MPSIETTAKSSSVEVVNLCKGERHGPIYIRTLRCLINVPPPALRLFIFLFFSNPHTLLGPPVYYFKKIEFITGLLCYFLYLLELFTPNFQGKLTCFCVYFSFTFGESLFLLFPLPYIDFKPFLEFQPPPFVLTPCLLNFGSLSNPP